MQIDKEFRHCASSRQVGSWILAGNFRRLFLRAQKVFKYLRFDFPYSFRNQNPRSKSAIKSTKNFKNFGFLSKQNFAQKERNVLVEMGILGDCFKRFV
jgi:hypothetical protein